MDRHGPADKMSLPLLGFGRVVSGYFQQGRARVFSLALAGGSTVLGFTSLAMPTAFLGARSAKPVRYDESDAAWKYYPVLYNARGFKERAPAGIKVPMGRMNE